MRFTLIIFTLIIMSSCSQNTNDRAEMQREIDSLRLELDLIYGHIKNLDVYPISFMQNETISLGDTFSGTTCLVLALDSSSISTTLFHETKMIGALTDKESTLLEDTSSIGLFIFESVPTIPGHYDITGRVRYDILGIPFDDQLFGYTYEVID